MGEDFDDGEVVSQLLGQLLIQPPMPGYRLPLQVTYVGVAMPHSLGNGRGEVCEDHPGLAHASTHEAGHAVAAVQHGIEFGEVSVVAPNARVWVGGGRMLGRLVPYDPPYVWVQADPVGALEFALAGFVAEEVLLGHALDQSFYEDIRVWRFGAGLAQANQMAEMEEFLGRTFDDVLDSLELWTEKKASWILGVGDALADPSGERRLSWEAIMALVDEC